MNRDGLSRVLGGSTPSDLVGLSSGNDLAIGRGVDGVEVGSLSKGRGGKGQDGGGGGEELHFGYIGGFLVSCYRSLFL